MKLALERGRGGEPRLPGRALVVGDGWVKAERHRRGRRDAERPRELVARAQRLLQDGVALPFVLVGQCQEHAGRGGRTGSGPCSGPGVGWVSDPAAWHPGVGWVSDTCLAPDPSLAPDLGAGKVAREDRLGADAPLGQAHRPNHAQADAMAVTVAAEAIPVVVAPQLERRALDVLPAERAADGDAQVLSRDAIRPQPLERQRGDAA